MAPAKLQIITALCLALPLPALAQSAPAAPAAAVYQGRTLSLKLDQALRQLNALSPISYTDPQTTKVFASTPATDIEKIAATRTGAAVEFWSNDSLDGMARESLVNVSWADLCAHCVYVVNDPENGADYQLQMFTGGNYVIQNSYRDVDDSGHLAAAQTGDLANNFSFDNAGDFARAKHVADLLSTVIALTAPAASAPPSLAAQPGGQAPEAGDPSGEVKLAVLDTPPSPLPSAPDTGSSYFQGPFAVRVGPAQGGVFNVDVVNISGQTHKVNIAVVDCENIAAADCGSQFAGSLAPGMKLSFNIHNNDASQTAAFQIDASQSSVASAQPPPGGQTLAAND